MPLDNVETRFRLPEIPLDDVETRFRFPEMPLDNVDGSFWLPKIAVEANQGIYLQPFRFKNRQNRDFKPERMLPPACETRFLLV
jgi:hypothetical protein